MSDTERIADRIPDYPIDRHAELKAAMKEAVSEWMDDKFREVGKWTVRGFIVSLFGALCYFIVHFGGFAK